MLNVQLPTGKTIQVSLYDFLFKLSDDEAYLFFQSCQADDLGIYIDDPFANKSSGKLTFEEKDHIIEEIPLDESEIETDDK